MKSHKYAPGMWVVYHKTKFSTSPGPRAREVGAASGGDTYSYVVDKFWVVVDVLDGERVRLVTRRGKEHVVDADDANLRPANWWEKLWWRRRYRDVERTWTTGQPPPEAE